MIISAKAGQKFDIRFGLCFYRQICTKKSKKRYMPSWKRINSVFKKKFLSEQPTASIYLPVNRLKVKPTKVAWPHMLNLIVVPCPPKELELNVMVMTMGLDVNFYCNSHSIIKFKLKFIFQTIHVSYILFLILWAICMILALYLILD
jgi:hypothetical protein